MEPCKRPITIIHHWPLSWMQTVSLRNHLEIAIGPKGSVTTRHSSKITKKGKILSLSSLTPSHNCGPSPPPRGRQSLPPCPVCSSLWCTHSFRKLLSLLFCPGWILSLRHLWFPPNRVAPPLGAPIRLGKIPQKPYSCGLFPSGNEYSQSSLKGTGKHDCLGTFSVWRPRLQLREMC